MNTFSKYLRQYSDDPAFDAYVGQWDELESIVISVYRNKIAITEAQIRFESTWPALRKSYAFWKPKLQPYWQQTRAAGAPTQLDPFQLLLDIQQPEDISGDWNAMQHLPAAREALNRYLVDHAAGDH